MTMQDNSGNQSDDNVTQSPEHIIHISPEWEGQLKKSKEEDKGVRYDFKTTDECPGYSFTITNWRFFHPINFGNESHRDLFQHIYNELQRMLGTSAFGNYNRAYSNKKQREKELISEYKELHGVNALGMCRYANDQFQQELESAFYKDLLASPRTKLLGVAFILLVFTRQTPYTIEKSSWPCTDALDRLIGFTPNIFDGRARLGILACPKTGDDYWVVSDFEQCEVEPISGNDHYSKTEVRETLDSLFQLMKHVPRETARLLKGSIRQKFGSFGTVDEGEFRSSSLFRNISWCDNQYTISKNAAQIIETLYIAHRSHKLPSLSQNEVFVQIFTADTKKWPAGKPRIQNYFRSGDAKRLWDDGFIGHDNKGNFHLNIKIHTDTH